MKTFVDCIPCFMNQALRTGRLVGLEESRIMDLLAEFGGMIRHIPMEDPPPRTAVTVYSLINRYVGQEDPFSMLKDQSTRQALGMYEELSRHIRESTDPLGQALKIAVAGNVIDFGISSTYDLQAELAGLLTKPFGIWHEDRFRSALKQADNVLYLGDNTGETVFDRLLIEILGKPVTYAVRGGPIINDVTMRDAMAAGLDRVCNLVSSGCRAPGILLDQCSAEFRRLFHSAPLIISKGQGNLEALLGVNAPVFFLLKAKCDVVARHLGVALGDLLLLDSGTIQH